MRHLAEFHLSADPKEFFKKESQTIRDLFHGFFGYQYDNFDEELENNGIIEAINNYYLDGTIEWNNYKRDMFLLSKAFPKVLFTLEIQDATSHKLNFLNGVVIDEDAGRLSHGDLFSRTEHEQEYNNRLKDSDSNEFDDRREKIKQSGISGFSIAAIISSILAVIWNILFINILPWEFGDIWVDILSVLTLVCIIAIFLYFDEGCCLSWGLSLTAVIAAIAAMLFNLLIGFDVYISYINYSRLRSCTSQAVAIVLENHNQRLLLEYKDTDEETHCASLNLRSEGVYQPNDRVQIYYSEQDYSVVSGFSVENVTTYRDYKPYDPILITE